MSPTPSNIPGMAPATNNLPTDNPDMAPTIIIGMLGGIIGPTVEEEAVTAQEKSTS